MQPLQGTSVDAAAGLLALMVARRGRIGAGDMQILDGHDAFRQLGISRERFLELADESLAGLGDAHHECSWLQVSDQAYVDSLLDGVVDMRQRDLVCRLAAAVVMADGNPAHDDRPVYHHVLGRWHVDPSALIEGSA